MTFRRVLVVRSIDIDNLNAQSRNAQQILAYWSSEQWRPTALTFGNPNPSVTRNKLVDVIEIRPDRMWRVNLWRLYQKGFDAIFYPGIHHRADYWALRSRVLFGRQVPVIATVEGLPGNLEDSSRELFYSSLAGHAVYCQKLPPDHLTRIEWINRMSDHLIAISPFLERMATARYGNKVSQLALGIDADRPERSKWQTAARPRVVSAGHVRSHKRPEFFLSLAQQFPDADFTWFGEGELRPALIAQAKEEGIGNLSFPGALQPPALAQELALADIFVLPSRGEGVPKVTQEAAQAGLAQIVFGYFEAPSVVDENNGYVVWDDAEFAARLAALLNNRSLTEHMGRAGVALMRNCTWEDIAPLWEERIIASAEAARSAMSLK